MTMYYGFSGGSRDHVSAADLLCGGLASLLAGPHPGAADFRIEYRCLLFSSRQKDVLTGEHQSLRSMLLHPFLIHSYFLA